MKVLLAALAAAMLLTQAAYAQRTPQTPSQLSDKEKARIREREAYEKSTEEAYKSTINRMPDVKKPVDPWGNIRTPAETGKK